MSEQKQQPVKRFRVGSVTAAVWKHGSNLSITLQKSYKEGTEWKDTPFMFQDDALAAIKALERAEQFVSEQ